MWDKFRHKIVSSYLNHGESVQIIAPPGFGKSRFGRSIDGLFVDPNLLQTPPEIITLLKTTPTPKIIILDSFNNLLTECYQPLFKYLKAIRDNNRGNLAYIFLTTKPITSEFQPILGDLYEIISEHVEYLPTLDTKDFDLFGFTPTTAQLKQILQLSGGIPALVKICVYSLRDKTTIDPKINSKLKAQLEEMLSVCPNHPAYSNSQIITEYFFNRKSTQLSASENHLLNLLVAKKGQLVTKDDICQTVYPDIKNYAGISDHSIDQLIHRLRSKINNRYTITTRRKIGYQLI